MKADTATAINIAKEFVQTCEKKGIPINSAFLFGSFAKGQQREYSDIDVALISDSFSPDDFIENSHKTALINWKFPDIEVHHFNTQIFTLDNSFINEIKRTGIRIV